MSSSVSAKLAAPPFLIISLATQPANALPEIPEKASDPLKREFQFATDILDVLVSVPVTRIRSKNRRARVHLYGAADSKKACGRFRHSRLCKRQIVVGVCLVANGAIAPTLGYKEAT